MSWLDVGLVVAVAVVLIVVVGLGRMAWRIWHDNEQMEPGGSIGNQIFGPLGKKRPPSEK